MNKTLYTKHKPIIEVDWSNSCCPRGKVGLEDYICQCYGLKAVELYDHGNEVYTYIVKKKEIDSYDQEEITEMLETGNLCIYSLHVVLTDLCNKDLVQPGEYVIDVRW